MAEDVFSAAEVRWQDRARCRGETGFDFTPDSENDRELERVRSAWCNACPVRPECLAYALLYHCSGYWGGTSKAERTKLSYRRDRVKCPVCRGKALISTDDGYGICLRCGTSWAKAPSTRISEESPR